MSEEQEPVVAESADPDVPAPEQFVGGPRRDQPRDSHTAAELEVIHTRALLAAEAASGLKAESIRVLDMHELVTYTDYLVVCTGRSNRQTRRISEEIGFKLKLDLGLMPAQVEADTGYEWVLMDYLDFIVHIFTPQAREFYRLDVLWKQAPVEEIE